VTDPRASLPGVDTVLADQGLEKILEALPRTVVVSAVREAIDEARASLTNGTGAPDLSSGSSDAAAALASRAAELAVLRARPTLRPVLNATGVILHTNLGRAPLARVAVERMAAAAEGYTNLEFDLETGSRGSRYAHCASLLCELTGAEAALVVNNAAAALILTLNTVARGRDVVVSRGELIEIGGGFRIPEIVERAGTRLHEVGTTNRTRLGDYERAAGPETGAVLKVHRSNFRIEGFSEEVSVPALKGLARDVGVPLVFDLGTGLMVSLEALGLPAEPTVSQAVEEGPDLLVFSGDKLLGGPQAGIILGRREWVERTLQNPLTRALRVDRLTLAGLEATLELYRDVGRARREVPTLRMIHEDPEALKARAETLAGWVGASLVAGSKTSITAVPTQSVVGGGTMPGAEIPSWGVRITAASAPSILARALRMGEGGTAAIVARVQGDAVILDLRTVEAKQDGVLRQALEAALR